MTTRRQAIASIGALAAAMRFASSYTALAARQCLGEKSLEHMLIEMRRFAIRERISIVPTMVFMESGSERRDSDFSRIPLNSAAWLKQP